MFSKAVTDIQRHRLDTWGAVALSEPKPGSETWCKALSLKSPEEATRSSSRAPKGHKQALLYEIKFSHPTLESHKVPSFEPRVAQLPSFLIPTGTWMPKKLEALAALAFFSGLLNGFQT